MESVILTLYNYASNTREEYLLLKLFETALREEILYVITIELKANCNVNSGRGREGEAIFSHVLKYLKPNSCKLSTGLMQVDPQDFLSASFFNILVPESRLVVLGKSTVLQFLLAKVMLIIALLVRKSTAFRR